VVKYSHNFSGRSNISLPQRERAVGASPRAEYMKVALEYSGRTASSLLEPDVCHVKAFEGDFSPNSGGTE
jgi:hypothetical protein